MMPSLFFDGVGEQHRVDTLLECTARFTVGSWRKTVELGLDLPGMR